MYIEVSAAPVEVYKCTRYSIIAAGTFKHPNFNDYENIHIHSVDSDSIESFRNGLSVEFLLLTYLLNYTGKLFNKGNLALGTDC